MGKRIGVLLAGCGVFDGSEIHEAVLTLLTLDREGADIICMAPDMEQLHVVNHLTQEPVEEKRNVLVESARIARGEIRDLQTVNEGDLDGLIIPGGFGAAKNLSDFAVKLPKASRDVRQVQEIPGVEADEVGAGEITREIAASLREFSQWWNRNKGRLAKGLPRELPRFHRKKLLKRSVELSMELVKAAEKKAAREELVTAGDFDSLVELLLWDYLDRDPRFTR